ncbi:MAG: DsbA family protein [Rhodospirillaceae bacterium]|nr:DsbA family protein [Rhodospirillaceae bacterium]
MRFFLKTLYSIIIIILSNVITAQAQEFLEIDQIIGHKDAPITIINYSSLTCLHCAEFHIKTFPKIKSEWIDTGKVKFIFRDFPMDTLSQATAMISHCSGNHYFAFLDIFFRNQERLINSQNHLNSIKDVAKLGGMDEKEIDQCIINNTLLKKINSRADDAINRYNINSVPSFIIEDKLYSGNIPYDEFSKLLIFNKE